MSAGVQQSSKRSPNDLRAHDDSALQPFSVLGAGGVEPAGDGERDDTFYQGAVKSQQNIAVFDTS